MSTKFKDLATSQKAQWSSMSIYKHTKVLNEYNIDYKTNKNNSITFYLKDKTYLLWGKTNNVYECNVDNKKFKTVSLEMTLLQFLKSNLLEPVLDEKDSMMLSQTLSFGKYKDKSLREILLNDRSYLVWLSNNIDVNDSYKTKILTAINYILLNSVDESNPEEVNEIEKILSKEQIEYELIYNCL